MGIAHNNSFALVSCFLHEILETPFPPSVHTVDIEVGRVAQSVSYHNTSKLKAASESPFVFDLYAGENLVSNCFWSDLSVNS